MFWKESPGLKKMPLSAKIGISAMLILAGIGYLFGFANIYSTYNLKDGSSGLGLEDITNSFYGARTVTALEKSIDSSMKEYFGSDKDYQDVKTWIQDGGAESNFPAIKEIFDVSCNTCHMTGVEVADVVLDSYEKVDEWLVQDTGKSVSRLFSISHTHILGTIAVLFFLIMIFSASSYSETVKRIVISIASISVFLDVGSWWLAKLSPFFSIFVLLGGIILGLTFGLLVILPLLEMWILKEKK